MKKSNERIIELLYRLLCVNVSAGAMLLLLSAFFVADDVTWKHFAVLFLTIGVFLAVKRLNRQQQIYAFLSIMLFLALLFGVAGRENFAGWVLASHGFLRVFVLGVFACVLQLLFEKYFFLQISFTVMMCILLLYSLFAKRHVPKMGVGLFLLYAVMTLTEYIRIACRKNKREKAQAYLVWISPFLALYFCILCLMPAPETPYGWQWLVNLYLRAEETITICVENFVNRNDEDLNGSISGFSENAALFSNVTVDNKNIMVIETSPGKKQPLYLTGKIYDSFDGREWKSTNEADGRERLLDTIETVCALEAYAKISPDHPIFNNSVRAESEYRHFRTDYLLAPSKTWKIKSRSAYRQRGADLVFDKKAEHGTEYSFQYCRMDMGRDAMRDFLQSDLAEWEELWERTAKKYTKDEITYEELGAYREKIRDYYLKETALSPETQEWVAAVTKDAENGVDRLFCIEEALAHMKYNTNPGGLPEEVTDAQGFLNYFLTESPEGFCTYYATAFVLLARAEGFPTRYVQGFCVPMGTAEETEVYSGMAHAWPEVYVEGKGWIPFEPTPGYGIRRYAADGEKTDKTGSLEKTQRRMEKEQGEDRGEASKEQEERERKKGEERKRAVLFLCKCVLFLLITSVIVFVIGKLGEKHREKGRSLDEKYRREVLRNLQILTMLGYERGQSETYQEFSARIGIGDVGNVIPTAFLETYESILYGTREAGEREIEECLEKGEELMRILRKEKGKRYLFYRIKLYFM